jgi:hypothetical protein
MTMKPDEQKARPRLLPAGPFINGARRAPRLSLLGFYSSSLSPLNEAWRNSPAVVNPR